MHSKPFPFLSCHVQIEEGWRSTDLAPCIELFETGFLGGCQRSNRMQLSQLSAEGAKQGLNSISY
jgi:hypothetical protein